MTKKGRTFASVKRKILWYKGDSQESRMFNLERKDNEMKKIVLTMVALLSMTAAFAEGEVDNEAAEAAKYEIRFNMNSLSKSLDLNYDQQKAVGDIMNMFASDMTNAAAASGNERAALRKKAVNRDLAYMRAVLEPEQYRTYVMLLNTTLNNRGFKK